MKIYLASSFRFVEDVKKLQEWLITEGSQKDQHEITCEWWHTDYKQHLKTKTINEWFSEPVIKVIYQRSLQAIRECDLLILVSPEPTKFNGANVEVGMALALGKPVIAYGQVEKSGMYEPLVRCSNLEQLALAMKEFEI